MAGGTVLADLLADTLAQQLIEPQPGPELDEQHHPFVLLPLLADDDALLHLA
ncbi:hypothetical protein D3C76_1694600 [compost metagenome]